MKIFPKTPQESLDKPLLRFRPREMEFERFKAELAALTSKIDEAEREDNQEIHVQNFFRDAYYRGISEVNKKGAIDLAIHLTTDKRSPVGVIIEAKRPGNRAEMLSVDTPNTKALHELVLYFMRERVDAGNIEIRYLAATNINEWFIFSTQDFNRHFFENKKFRKQYEDWRDDLHVSSNTSHFYNEIAKPFIDQLDATFDCTHFDLREYASTGVKKLIALYKLLSPYHLLKAKFTDDSNTLDKRFYIELLHIIGLEEYKEKSKTLIRRKTADNTGSLMEMAVTMLETKDVLPRVENPAAYGDNREKRHETIALELCITWTNRILFLKLLEAQLVGYHEGDEAYRFLNLEMVRDFDELFALFHQILARTTDERQPAIRDKFARVPYLNSSLFEPTELENQTITIESLKDHEQLPIIGTSILRKLGEKAVSLRTLEYLFRFLDAYDFASEGKDDIQSENRLLINASVLGKVFEKINGYKDGSIYTPGFITMYMCRQAIRLAVVQKFKDETDFDGADFDELTNWVKGRNYQKENIRRFNEIIDRLKICDPAVGSGHFLVSALNEMLAIKSEFGIFADEDYRAFGDYSITIANDELILSDRENNLFEYKVRDGKPLNAEMQRLQSTLFHEKQKLIENCLFGVDINPNSVKICRLRLWIELLKNAYYKFGVPPSGGLTAGEVPPKGGTQNDLETLPNIDINIKEGNSLISRFALDADLADVLKQVNFGIDEYRSLVTGYKETRDREAKRDFEKRIKRIKEDFKTQLFSFSPERVKLKDLRDQLTAEEQRTYLFGEDEDKKEKRLKKIEKLKADVEKQTVAVKAIEENAIYEKAFEWRFEFPEVLDDDGSFLGFDVVIGNPPYIKEAENRSAFEGVKRNPIYQGKMDIWYLFGALGIHLLKENRFLCYIATNNWVTNDGASRFRNFVVNESRFLALIDFGSFMAFENASIQTMIMLLQKDKSENGYNFRYERLVGEKLKLKDGINFLEGNNTDDSLRLFPVIHRTSLIDRMLTFNSDERSILLEKLRNKQNFFLHEKADKKNGIRAEVASGIDVLQDFVSDSNVDKLGGIARVGDGVFILSNQELEALDLDENEKEIVKPYFTTEQLHKYYGEPANSHWIIYTKSDINNLDKKSKKRPIDNYPKIKNHLDRFKPILTSAFAPYGLHRTREQHLFEGEKIFALRKCPREPRFTYTNFDCYVVRTFFVIQSDRIDLKYLTGLLNSKLIAFWLRSKGKMQGNSYQLDKRPILEIPIFYETGSYVEEMVALVDQILELKKSGGDTTALERQIDEMVYELYELTADEIAIVEEA